MRKFYFICILFLLCNNRAEAQNLNWNDVLYGDFKSLKANNIKNLQFKKRNKVLKSVKIDIEKKQIISKDSLTTDYFNFDVEGRLISLQSIENNKQEKFDLNYKENRIDGLSRSGNNDKYSYYDELSKRIFQSKSYQDKVSYRINKKKNDTSEVFKIKHFFNEKNPDLSYEESYQNGKIWVKKYFNNTEVRKEKFDDHFIVDSTLQKDYKQIKYHFENYPDHQIIKIEKDSVLTINKKSGKKISEKLEYASLPFKEIFYDENEEIKEKIIYFNHRNSFNEMILWEEAKYDGNGKLISRKFPNKKEYKLKNGILVYRKKMIRYREIGGTCSFNRRILSTYYPQLYSSSILFTPKLGKNFIDNFDVYAIDPIIEDEEMMYAHLDFKDAAEIMREYSVSKDVKDELRRTSRSIKRKERYVVKYFEGMEVEAETAAGKKYIINLAQNPELLSFSIHIFLLKD